MPPVLYTADVVLPMTGPPLPDGGVLVDGGVVVAVGEAPGLRADAQRIHHVAGVLLPALVNGHTHLEHSDAAVLARPGPQHAWLQAIEGLTDTWDPERWERSAHRGVLENLRAGAATVIDVVTRGPAVPAASRAGLAGSSLVAIDEVDVATIEEVLVALEHALGLPADGRRVGIAPSAPYRLGSGVLRSLAVLAARREVPLQIHAAQTSAEVTALREGDGPLADQARERGLRFEWLDDPTNLTPVRYLDACGALGSATSIVGGVTTDVLEARLLAERGATVVCTPRSNALLGIGPVPLERYADVGVGLALGTEGAGCGPDADLLAEAAAWVALARERGLVFWPSAVGPIGLEEQAVRLLTCDGARALGWGDHSGVLEPGRSADLLGVALPISAHSAYADLIDGGAGRQVLTVVAGVRRSRRADGDTPWPSLDRDR